MTVPFCYVTLRCIIQSVRNKRRRKRNYSAAAATRGRRCVSPIDATLIYIYIYQFKLASIASGGVGWDGMGTLGVVWGSLSDSLFGYQVRHSVPRLTAHARGVARTYATMTYRMSNIGLFYTRHPVHRPTDRLTICGSLEPRALPEARPGPGPGRSPVLYHRRSHQAKNSDTFVSMSIQWLTLQYGIWTTPSGRNLPRTNPRSMRQV